jgi:hypothetical protein
MENREANWGPKEQRRLTICEKNVVTGLNQHISFRDSRWVRDLVTKIREWRAGKVNEWGTVFSTIKKR